MGSVADCFDNAMAKSLWGTNNRPPRLRTSCRFKEPPLGEGARMCFSFRLLLEATRLLRRARRDLVLENLALRPQLAIYQRSQRRPVVP